MIDVNIEFGLNAAHITVPGKALPSVTARVTDSVALRALGETYTVVTLGSESGPDGVGTLSLFVGEAVGMEVGVDVGWTVGTAVGTAVGVPVGVDEGKMITAVGVAVGMEVGEEVGRVVGREVG